MSWLEKIIINGVDYDINAIEEGTEQNVDLVFSDANDNALVAFSGGHLKTKNFDSSARLLSVLMEGGGIGTDGIDLYSIASYEGESRTAFFIYTGGAKAVLVGDDVFFAQYSSTHQLISAESFNAGLVELANTCAYIRFSVREQVGERVPIVFYGGADTPAEEKKVQLHSPSERLVYKVNETVCTTARLKLPPNYTVDGFKVPLIIWDSGDGSFTSWDSELGAPGYEGRVNGLNYLCDQGFAILEIYSWGSYNYLNHSGCGGRSAMPISSHIATHEKGVEYVLSRYNIDAGNIFHLSKSGSGKLALYYALERPKFNLKSIYAMAPVFDDLNFMSWGMDGYRKALFDELNLQGTEDQVNQFKNGTPKAKGGNGTSWRFFNPEPHAESDLDPNDPDDMAIYNANLASNQAFIRNNIDKFTTVVPGWMNLVGQTIDQKFQDTIDFARTFWAAVAQGQQGADATGEACYTRHNLQMVGDHVPFKVIMAKNDEQTPYWDCLEVVDQLLNGGDEASIHTLDSGGHSAPDLSTSGTNYVANVTTRLGVHYDGVSIGWYVACEDIFARFLQNYLNP